MNILHLSDIHFGRNDPIYGLNEPFAMHDRILDELIETVGKLDPALRPEHIVFTGDIAWHGKRSEFSEAYEWFSRLLDAVKLTGKDISFCVGNHDVDWGYRCIDTKLNDNAVDEISRLYRYENVHLLEPSIYAYDEFCRRIGMIPYAYPNKGKREYSYSVGYKDVPFACGKTVRLISMNTSLLIAQPGISEDKMWLGQEQIRSLIEYGVLPSDESIWYTVMLYHHADRFLHPNETSTYDGRSATLPLMLSYADLLLCGHTESSGKPRLTKQLGGGMLLSAGASYYNDVHRNAFSMIYLSDERRTAGFLPYVYNDGWQDYDFEQPEVDAVRCHTLGAEGELHRGMELILSADSEKYCIKTDCLLCRSAADGSISVNNREDFMNHFSLEAERRSDGGAELRLCMAENWKHYLRTILTWKEYDGFLARAEEAAQTRWSLCGNDGRELLYGDRLPQRETLFFDRELTDRLRTIEFYFDVRFTLPENITENDLQKIEMLTELAEQGSTLRLHSPQSVEEDADRAMLESLCTALSRTERLFLQSRESCTLSLFGVSICFGTVTVVSGPYNTDAEQARKKLATYCEGDRRRLQFTATEGTTTRLICGNAADKSRDPVMQGEILTVSRLPLLFEC